MSTPRVASLKIARWLSLVIAGILVLLPLSTFFTTWTGATFGHLEAWRLWKEVIIVASLPLVVALVWQEPKLWHWLKNSWFVRLFTLYILLHLALSIWALKRGQVNHPALIDGLLTNLRFLGFFIVCAIVASLDGFLKRNWIRLTLVPAALVVGLGLLQRFILPLNFLSHFGYGPKTTAAYQTIDARPSMQRLQSTLRGANPLGAYLSFVVPAWLVSFNKRRHWQVIGLVLGVVVLGFTYSRSAYIATLLAISLLALIYLKPRRSWLVYLATGLVILSGSLYGLRNQQFVQDTILHTSRNSASAQSSNAVRASSLRSAWHDIVHQPLGRGPGTAGPASAHNDHPARIAENYYLQIGQEVGVLGIALFVAMNAVVARQLWQRRDDKLALILLVTLAGISLINLVSHAWADDTLSLIWWGLAGVACAPAILKAKDSR